MKLGILNGELGIVVVDSLADLGYIQEQELKKLLPAGGDMSNLVMFYMQDRDWIVLNKSHELYEYYSQIIPAYLGLSRENREEARCIAPTEGVKTGLEMIEEIINRRRILYKSEQKEGVTL